jgi:hypothetical protein
LKGIRAEFGIEGATQMAKQVTERDRRTFLKTGAALGTTLLASPDVHASPAAPDARRSAGARLGERTLGTGTHSLRVSSLGLGCMGMSYHRSFIPERAVSVSLIRKAVDMGVTLFRHGRSLRAPHERERRG